MSATSERAFEEILPDGRTTMSVSFRIISVLTLGLVGESGVSNVPASGFGPCPAPARLSSAASKSVMEADFAFLVRRPWRETVVTATPLTGDFTFGAGFPRPRLPAMLRFGPEAREEYEAP